MLAINASSHMNADSLDPVSPILFLFIALVLGSSAHQTLKAIKRIFGIRLPYSVGLICIGIFLGLILYRSLECENKDSYTCINRKGVGTNGQFQETMLMWMNIPGNVILFVFLPPLIYEGSAYTNVYKFAKHFSGGLVLAVPGVIIQTALIGCVAKYMFPYNWNWVESFLFGGILSANDPIAVISLLKELGCLPDLRVLIEAESILNDGTAIVIYELCYMIMLEPGGTIGDHVQEAFKLSLGGVGMGVLFCGGTMLLLSKLHNPLIETTVTIAAAYLCFFAAQASVHVSGVLAVMTLGLLLTMYGQETFSNKAVHYLHVFWSMIEFMANTVIFVLAGAIIVFKAFLLKSDIITGQDWGLLFAHYILLFFIRLAMLLLLSPCIRYFGYRLTARDCSLSKFLRYMVFAAWGGLRGVVGMSLGLIISNDQEIAERASDPLFRERVLFHVSGIVALTLLINGPTCEYVIMVLGLGPASDLDQAHLDGAMLADARDTVARHSRKQVESMRRRQRGSVMQTVDWDTVNALTSVAPVDDLPGPGVAEEDANGRVEGPAKSKNGVCSLWGKQMSIRLYEMCLEVVKEAYKEQLSYHLLGGSAFRLLEHATNCADDFIQAQKSAPHAIEADAFETAGGPCRLFDVAWMPGYGGCTLPRWRRWAGRLLPAALRGALVQQGLRIQVEAALAALEAYNGLEKRLADERFRGHIIRGQVTDVLCSIEVRLAHLQYEHPVLCAVAGAQRAAVGVLRAAVAEVQRLHDEFKISSADSETLIDAHKRRVHEVHSQASAVRPPSVESLVSGIPLFRALPPDRFRTEWASLLSMGALRFAAGEQMMEAGRLSTGPLIIIAGFAKVFGCPAATTTGRFLRLAVAGSAEGCVEWLAILEGGPTVVRDLRTVVAETDVEAVRISPEALRALVAAAGPEALRELQLAYGDKNTSRTDPVLLPPTGTPAGWGSGKFEPVPGRSRMASPSTSVRLAWMGSTGEQGSHDSESADSELQQCGGV